MRREHAVHERLQAVGLLHDHLRELAQVRVRKLALEELRGAADAAQGVLDLVREVADQLPVGLLLLEELRLAGDAHLLVELAKLDEQARPVLLDGDGDAVHGDLLPGDLEGELVVVESGVVVHGLREAGEEALVARQHARERRAQEVLAPVREQRLGGGVGVGHLEAVVEHEHGGREQLEAREVRRHARAPGRRKARAAPAKRAGASAEGECRKGRLREARASSAPSSFLIASMFFSCSADGGLQPPDAAGGAVDRRAHLGLLRGRGVGGLLREAHRGDERRVLLLLQERARGSPRGTSPPARARPRGSAGGRRRGSSGSRGPPRRPWSAPPRAPAMAAPSA